jgi:Flp pilus assembly protein TadB
MPAKRQTKKQSPSSPGSIPAPEPIPPAKISRETTTSSFQQEKKPRFKLPSFNLAPRATLQKLRLAVLTIFLLSTLSIILVFVSFAIAVVFILISYLLLFVLLVKLLRTKKL